MMHLIAPHSRIRIKYPLLLPVDEPCWCALPNLLFIQHLSPPSHHTHPIHPLFQPIIIQVNFIILDGPSVTHPTYPSSNEENKPPSTNGRKNTSVWSRNMLGEKTIITQLLFDSRTQLWLSYIIITTHITHHPCIAYPNIAYAYTLQTHHLHHLSLPPLPNSFPQDIPFLARIYGFVDECKNLGKYYRI